MPKVTICIPVYNVEQYIGRCLESVLSQSLQDIEVIIVNDCTPDNSMSVVDEYARKDTRIKIINHEQNHGLMWARRTGYMAASGDYITFCDSDDTLPVDAIEKLYDCAIESKADIVSGNIRFIKSNGEENIWYSSLNYGEDVKGIYKSLLKTECTHNLCSKLFKRELLQNHIYETFESFTNGEDGCLFYQVVKNSSRMIQIEEIVYNYYQNVNSSSQAKYNSRALHSMIVFNKLRVEMCSKYPSLSHDLFTYVSTVLNEFLASGYNRDGSLKKEIEVNGLVAYIDMFQMFKNLDAKRFMTLIVKRCIRSLI